MIGAGLLCPLSCRFSFRLFAYVRSLFPLVALGMLLLSSCATTREETYPKPSYAVASWYGREFNGRPTSSGEIFNMNMKTCAHREYPFGTKLKVTNASNNRAVECTVNDRGPFAAGRDIDLSYAAAKEIGLTGRGTSRVVIEVKGRDESYIKKVKVQTAGSAGPFAIQIGSFTDASNAERLKAALTLKYSNVYVDNVKIKGAQRYRVRVGNFDTLSKTIALAGKLGFEGYPTVVVRADTKM